MTSEQRLFQRNVQLREELDRVQKENEQLRQSVYDAQSEQVRLENEYIPRNTALNLIGLRYRKVLEKIFPANMDDNGWLDDCTPMEIVKEAQQVMKIKINK